MKKIPYENLSRINILIEAKDIFYYFPFFYEIEQYLNSIKILTKEEIYIEVLNNFINLKTDNLNRIITEEYAKRKCLNDYLEKYIKKTLDLMKIFEDISNGVTDTSKNKFLLKTKNKIMIRSKNITLVIESLKSYLTIIRNIKSILEKKEQVKVNDKLFENFEKILNYPLVYKNNKKY